MLVAAVKADLFPQQAGADPDFDRWLHAYPNFECCGGGRLRDGNAPYRFGHQCYEKRELAATKRKKWCDTHWKIAPPFQLLKGVLFFGTINSFYIPRFSWNCKTGSYRHGNRIW
jgi:hypothetical protein